MYEEGRRSGRAQSVPLCPVCGHRVGTAVKRYKTLGTFVPRWIPEPCANPDCGKHSAPSAKTGRRDVGLGAGRGAHRADVRR